MKALSLETTKLLDKMYNLRGSDSVILVEMDKQKDKAEETLERTTVQKGELQTQIANLEKQHEELATQGDKLKEALSGINREEFATVLDSLKIDFNPEELMNKVNDNLPKTIEKVSKEKEQAESELVSVEDEMNNAITTIEELGLRRDTALANQDKLNEYFELALNGKINTTRDSITSLLEQFDAFTEEERREGAKILMFPEDTLYIYNEKVSNSDVAGKSISDVIAEAKDAIVEEEPEEVEVEEEVVTPNLELEQEEPFINPFLIDEGMQEHADPEPKIEEVVETPVEEVSDEDLKNCLDQIGLQYLDFSSQDLDELQTHFNPSLFEKNVNFMKENNIDIDLFIDFASLLYDEELIEKVQILLNIGKEPIDIYLNPSILAKYTTETLKDAVTTLTSNGMDPKNVPLMAY